MKKSPTLKEIPIDRDVQRLVDNRLVDVDLSSYQSLSSRFRISIDDIEKVSSELYSYRFFVETRIGTKLFRREFSVTQFFNALVSFKTSVLWVSQQSFQGSSVILFLFTGELDSPIELFSHKL